MADALKPCPCCGGEAKMEQYRADGLRIQCRTCALKREQRWLRYGREWLEEKMIADWNHRALPAPAGEPEMPLPSHDLLNVISEYAMARTDQVSQLEVTRRWKLLISGIYAYASAYGDARAEHARRVAMEDAALTCEGEAVESTEHESDKGYNMAIRHCADAIRAAAPPQGEQTCSTKRV